jgi:hypothetical protein
VSTPAGVYDLDPEAIRRILVDVRTAAGQLLSKCQDLVTPVVGAAGSSGGLHLIVGALDEVVQWIEGIEETLSEAVQRGFFGVATAVVANDIGDQQMKQNAIVGLGAG